VHWDSLLDQTDLKGNSVNSFEIKGEQRRVTHLRLNIFPDGGVARLRVHGEVVPDSAVFASEVDLAAIEHGGFVIECSDMHYGHRQNLIMPGRATHMGDGWETKRRRGPGHDWSIIRLAKRGTITRIELDTDHFKGNAPGKCMLEYTDVGDGSFSANKAKWKELMMETPLEPHTRHLWYEFDSAAATHVRLNIYPDGGVARLRLFGTLSD
jgi:allantoicase